MSDVLRDWLVNPADNDEVVLERIKQLLGDAFAGAVSYDSSLFVELGAEGSHVMGGHKGHEGRGPAGLPRGFFRVQFDFVRSPYEFAGYCTYCHETCDHVPALLLAAVKILRPAVWELISKQPKIPLVSASASTWLTLLSAPVADPVEPDAIQVAERSARFSYFLDPGRSNFRQTLSFSEVRLRGVQNRRNWSGFLQKIQPAQKPADDFHDRYRYQYVPPVPRINFPDYISQEDLAIGKLLFIATTLGDSAHLMLRGKEVTHVLKKLATDGQLFVDNADSALKLGGQRTFSTRWSRNVDFAWELKLAVENGGDVILTEPLMYVDHSAGVIGELGGKISPAALDALLSMSAIPDIDIVNLREAIGDASPGGLPSLPDVKIVQGGMLRPTPILKLARDGQRSSDYRNAAVAQVKFDYHGRHVELGDNTPLFNVDGLTRVEYSRDLEFEENCFKQIKRRSVTKKGRLPGQVVVAVGDPADQRIFDTIDRYHKEVAPTLSKQGWRLDIEEGWSGGAEDLHSLDFSLSPADRGFYDLEVIAEIDGTRSSMLTELVNLLSRKEVLAQLLSHSSDATFTLERTAEGYLPLVGPALLRKILPLITLLIQDEKTGQYRIRSLDFGALDAARRDTDSQLHGGAELAELAHSLRTLPAALPEQTLKAMSAPPWPHQVEGALWCDVRRAHGFGAIIGDEYATGKTLQGLITLHDAWLEDDAMDRRTSLVVVSKTLYHEARWQEEAAEFFPRAPLVDIVYKKGMCRFEELTGEEFAVITTYDTLVRYVDTFVGKPWNVVACDEGHKLGNTSTNVYKAVKALQARQKLIITGSAMQNAAAEMWSVMDLAVPCLLREKAWFSRVFPRNKMASQTSAEASTETIQTQSNRAKLVALGKMISPFYLRRLNSELGRSLPKITEVRHSIILGKEQAAAYESIRAIEHESVKKTLAEGGLGKSQFAVLQSITRLRQVCDHPLLVGVEGIPSAKSTALYEICVELLGEGKRVVISSTFRSMLDIIESDFGENRIATVRIDGSVSGAARKRASEAFRAGKVSILLIQLSMAEGIELPEGDTIILFEPWWNSKKEEQAIARLRRDERDKHVTVLRFVVSNSVEEGVLKIATRKLADIEAVHEGQSLAAGAGLTLEDIEGFFRPLPMPDMED